VVAGFNAAPIPTYIRARAEGCAQLKGFSLEPQLGAWDYWESPTILMVAMVHCISPHRFRFIRQS